LMFRRATPSDQALIASKSRGRRLGFAVLLLFFRANRRFPESDADVGAVEIAGLAAAIGVKTEATAAIFAPGRSVERHRAEIRVLLGFREATVADAETLTTWARDHAVARTRDVSRLVKDLTAQCGVLFIEPPTPDRMERIARAAVRAYEDRLHGTTFERLTPEMRKRLDALLQAVSPDEATPCVPQEALEGQAPAMLNMLRGAPAAPASIACAGS
jgi:hypothetical protein